MKKSILVGVFAGALAQSGLAQADSAQSTDLRWRVTDLEGRAISNPKIYLGDLATTSPGGRFLTIEASGYVRSSHWVHQGTTEPFQLRRAPEPLSLKLQGQTPGYGKLVGNGILDVSLVYRALPCTDVASLELTQLISPEVDEVSVYGESLFLPANLAVPSQTESYFVILPVSLNKPTFSVAAPWRGVHKWAAAHARFDFKKTVDDLRNGKSFFDVINRLEFRSFTLRDIDVQPTHGAINIPLGENVLGGGATVSAGKSLPAGYAMLATALAADRGSCVITDTKRLLRGEKRQLKGPLKGPLSGSSLIVRSIKKYSSDRIDFSGSDFEEMSSVVTPAPVNALGAPSKTLIPEVEFLPILKGISFNQRAMIFEPPLLPRGLSPRWTRIQLSKVELVDSGSLWLLRKTPLWDFHIEGHAREFTIPYAGNDPWAAKGRYRWELTFGAAADGSLAGSSGGSPATHITKTAVDWAVN